MPEPELPPVPTTTVRDLPDPLPDGWVLLDVREDDEWAAGHADGAVHIPLGQLPTRYDEIPDGELVVVCRVGGRSTQAVGWLGQAGRGATNLEGGMLAWERAGRAMVAAGGEPHIA